MSKSQRPRYYEYDGRKIKCKGTRVQRRFYKEGLINPELITTRDYLLGLLDVIENFKEQYVLGYYRNKKVIHSTKFSYEATNIYKDGKWILCEEVGKAIIPIVANSRKVGTPRYYLIKGQDIYSGNLREHMRGFVMDKIKECFKPYITNIPVINEYPVKISCKLYDTIKNPYHKVKDSIGQQWDIDNYMFPYNKAFPDLLVAEKILRNDDRLHLPSSIGTEFVPIENHEDRKLVYTIERDDREEIKDIIGYHDANKALDKEHQQILTENNQPY